MAIAEKDEFLNLELLSRVSGNARKNVPLLFVIITVCLFIALSLFANWPRTYTAKATIAPGDNISETSSGGLASLRSAAGINSLLGSGAEASPFEMYLDLLTSKALADNLAHQDHMLQIVYSKLWNAQTGHWKRRSGSLHFISYEIKRALRISEQPNPESEDLARFIARHLSIESVPSPFSAFSKIMYIRFKYNNPLQSTHFLDIILKGADNILRDQKLSNVKSRINYLSSTIPGISTSEQRQAITSVLIQQESLYTILKSDKTYGYTLLDPPFTSNSPSSPSLVLFFIFTLLCSALIWVFILLLLPPCTGFFEHINARHGQAADGARNSQRHS